MPPQRLLPQLAQDLHYAPRVAAHRCPRRTDRVRFENLPSIQTGFGTKSTSPRCCYRKRCSM
jgi:hypothetical protein